ncbi:unnamed protein product, partial [Litomosoides sigmodontis]
ITSLFVKLAKKSTDEDGLMLRKFDSDFRGGEYEVDVISDVPNNDELKHGTKECEVGVTGGVSNSKEFKFGVNESN